MKYEEPTMELVIYEQEDVIRTSQPGLSETTNNQKDNSGWNTWGF